VAVAVLTEIERPPTEVEKWKNDIFKNGNSDKEGVAVAWGVAVAGWQWWQSKEEIKAVRMVPVKKWQCQYWQR
jgi:hypothetical protein